MLLFVKIATTDKLREGVEPVIVALAAELTQMDGTPRDFVHTRVRLGSGHVKPDAQEVHGISSRMAGRDGVSVVVALGMLCGMAAQAQYLIGHGIGFDRDVVIGALGRLGKDARMLTRPGLQVIDTMLAATPVCKLAHEPPFTSGAFRWPSLDEVAESVLHELPSAGPQSCWDKLGKTKRIYFALRQLNVLEAA